MAEAQQSQIEKAVAEKRARTKRSESEMDTEGGADVGTSQSNPGLRKDIYELLLNKLR